MGAIMRSQIYWLLLADILFGFSGAFRRRSLRLRRRRGLFFRGGFAGIDFALRRPHLIVLVGDPCRLEQLPHRLCRSCSNSKPVVHTILINYYSRGFRSGIVESNVFNEPPVAFGSFLLNYYTISRLLFRTHPSQFDFRCQRISLLYKVPVWDSRSLQSLESGQSPKTWKSGNPGHPTPPLSFTELLH